MSTPPAPQPPSPPSAEPAPRPVPYQGRGPGAPSLASLMAGWPVEHGVGAVVDRVEPGAVTVHTDLVPGRLDENGQPVTAVLSCLADCVIGISVFSSFELPTGGPTVEMRVDRADPLGPGARVLVAEGSVDHQRGWTGLGRALFRDDTGAVVAHAMATMASAARDAGERTPRPATGPASTSGAPGPVALFDPVALERLEAWTGDDPLRAVVPVDPSMANPLGQVHGGVLLAIAERAQRRAHNPGSVLLSASIEYLRPVTIDTPTIECRSTVVRRGRRFSTVRTDMVRPDGKPAAVATSIAVDGAPPG